MSVTMPEVGEQEDLLTELFRDWAVACDYNREGYLHQNFGFGSEAAKWIAFLRCPDCGYSLSRLICESCKDAVTASEDAGVCDRCNSITVPFRHMVLRFEPLTKGVR